MIFSSTVFSDSVFDAAAATDALLPGGGMFVWADGVDQARAAREQAVIRHTIQLAMEDTLDILEII